MQYTIITILTYWIALSSCSSTAQNRFHQHNAKDALDVPSLGEDADLTKRPYDSCKDHNHKYTRQWAGISLRPVIRHRRSLWTSFIKRITAPFETLHMKPLLAGGMNDLDDFGKKFNGRVRVSPKSANVMQMKGGAQVKKKTGIKIPAKITDINKEVKEIDTIYNEVKEREINLIEKLVGKYPTVKDEELFNIYWMGVKDLNAEKVINHIFKNDPSIKEEILKEIEQIRVTREAIKKREDAVSTILKKLRDVPMEDLKKFNQQLESIRVVNNRWLQYKTIPATPITITTELSAKKRIKMLTADLKKDASIIVKLNGDAMQAQIKLVGQIIKRDPLMNSDTQYNLFSKGLNEPELQKHIEKLLNNNPDIKEKVMSKIDEIKQIRKNIDKLGKELSKKLEEDDFSIEDYVEVEAILKSVLLMNNRWLHFKNS